MEYNLPDGTRFVADKEFYSSVNLDNIAERYSIYGIYMFSIPNFRLEFHEFYKEVRLLENRQFLDELVRTLHLHPEPPLVAIEYILNNTPENILPAYLRTFSQISLLIETNFNENLGKAGYLIAPRITCDMVPYFNDIELCCFFVRYCKTKEVGDAVRGLFCEEIFGIIEARLSGLIPPPYGKCQCKKNILDVEPKQC